MNPPPPSISPYFAGGSPRLKRHKPNDPIDVSHSRFFPTPQRHPERHHVNVTHDLTCSDSQDDLYDLKSNSSTGKSKAARVGVKEFRDAHPKSIAARSRTRKSRSSLGHRRLLEGSGKGNNTSFDTPDRSKKSESLETPNILGEYDPPPANVRSDVSRARSKRPRSAFHTETISPSLKRPRIHESVESIESEDELAKNPYPEKRRTNFSDLVGPKRTSSRGDIPPTQFLKPRAEPVHAPVYARKGNFCVMRAVCGKYIYAGTGAECELILRQAQDEPAHLLAEYTRDANSPPEWLAIDLDKMTRMEHAATRTHFVHVVRPRSNHFEGSLWLQFMDHCDVMGLICCVTPNRLVELSA